MDRTEIVEMVLEALRDEMAAVADDASTIVDVTEDTPLLGDGAPVDSLGLVSVVVEIEQRLADAHGYAITLVDERAMSQRNSPFRTVGALANYALESISLGPGDA
jgi:acyl carrier protein